LVTGASNGRGGNRQGQNAWHVGTRLRTPRRPGGHGRRHLTRGARGGCIGGRRAGTIGIVPAVELEAEIDAARGAQRLDVPFFGPLAPTADQPAALLETGALYTGESVARIDEIRPAAEVVKALAP
jgi:hypothetical protein